MYKNRPCVGQGTAPKNSNVREDHVIHIMFLYVSLCKNQPSSHQNLNSFQFLAQLIAVLNSYPHSMSPIARLKRSAFLRGGFTAL